MASRRDVAVESVRTLGGAERAALFVLAAGALVIPTVLGGGSDPFRMPKELAFRAEAIVLLAIVAFWITARRHTWTFRRRPELIVAGAIVVWTVVTAIFSTNRQLSVDSLITVVAAVVIFIGTCLAAQTTSLVAVDVLMIACCSNALLVILQELLTHDHYGSVGFLGNSNDVGTFLLTPAVAAIVLSVTSNGTRRRVYAAIGVLLICGIAAAGTRTAFFALVASLLVFAVAHSRRAAVAVAITFGIVALLILSPATAIGRGLRKLARAATNRDYQHLFSERLLPFLAAVDMTRDHPLLGTGPGCFKYHYMAYRVGLRERYPTEWTRGWPMNWGEVHNDHLQVASEAGLPGYALFLLAIGAGAGIASPAKRRAGPASPEATFARAMRWPLATAVFVVCLAQFPLELAAPRLMLITLGALCITWDRDDAAA